MILRSDGRGEKGRGVERMELVQELELQTLLRATKSQKEEQRNAGRKTQMRKPMWWLWLFLVRRKRL